ncbi:MAG: pilus assembly protein PilP [Oligoflexales bacterium]
MNIMKIFILLTLPFLMAQVPLNEPASSSNFLSESDTDKKVDNKEETSELDRRAADSLVGLFWESYGDEESKEIATIEQKVRLGDSREPISEYRYASFYQADPFVEPKATILEKKLEIPITNQLQRYDTQALSVKGIWQDSQGVRKALILASDNVAVVAKIGDAVGRRGGRITEMEKDRVIVREFYFSDEGNRQFQDVSVWNGGITREEKDSKIEMSSQVTLESMDGLGFLERKEILERKELQKIEKNRISQADKIKQENNQNAPNNQLPGGLGANDIPAQ